jgi:hypothetical protein
MKPLITCLLFASCLLSLRATSEAPAVSPVDPELTATLLDLDARMFAAFNAADLEAFKPFLAPEVEFYHDKDGVSGYTQTIAALDRLFRQAIRPQRTLLPGTTEVYPIKDYGAVQIGSHRFSVVQNGQESCTVYKFIHTWRLRDGHWQLTRVISVGH